MIDTNKYDIIELFDKNRQYIVPLFQRRYSWSDVQCYQLWSDILDIIKYQKNNHFLGTLVVVPDKASKINKFRVIDGQQRLTSLTILFIALRDFVEKEFNDIDFNIEYINELIINEHKKEKEYYKLILTDKDEQSLFDLIDKKYNYNLSENITKAYNNFYKWIYNCKDYVDYNLLYDTIKKLVFVVISIDNEDNPQGIFESLNSKGETLSQFDLIKNFILMNASGDEQDYLYEDYIYPIETFFNSDNALIDNFFRDYLTMNNLKIPKIENIYKEFKNYYLIQKNNGINNTDICKNLYKYAKFYSDMVMTKEIDETLKNRFISIQSLRMNVVFPFLLYVYNQYSENLINKNDFIEILDLCISYVVRRNICNYATNSLNKTFATFRNNIDENNILDSIKYYFRSLQWYKKFPDDEEFKEKIKNTNLYWTRNINYILFSLENYERNVLIEKKYQVEHIMPQNSNLNENWKNMLGENWEEIHNIYLHTLGNLTLTDINAKLGDKSFVEKRDLHLGYRESALQINSYVNNCNEWNENTIKERAGLLAEKAVKIWKYPY